MSYSAKIIADSTACGSRLTTMELVFPRIVLAEFNTHRAFSRNSASSRAIPIEKQIERVLEHPYVPNFRHNQKGMQPAEELSLLNQARARVRWFNARDQAVDSCLRLGQLNVHKQWCNRLLEPFMWHTVIVTATEWQNFFGLRCSPMAQDEIRIPAELAEAAYRASTPKALGPGAWHTPYVELSEAVGFHMLGCYAGQDATTLATRVSAARCARVSYLTQDGRRDVAEDLTLYERLTAAQPPHLSPLEHVAIVETGGDFASRDYGNFCWPWLQLRKLTPNERVAGPTSGALNEAPAVVDGHPEPDHDHATEQ